LKAVELFTVSVPVRMY